MVTIRGIKNRNRVLQNCLRYIELNIFFQVSCILKLKVKRKDPEKNK